MLADLDPAWLLGTCRGRGVRGAAAGEAAGAQGIRLTVVKLPEAKRGFVLLPCRWVVDRSLARDHERLAATLRGLHLLAFTIMMLRRFVTLMTAHA